MRAEDKTKVAITVWNDRIAPVFEVAGRVLLSDSEDGGFKVKRYEELPKGSGEEKVEYLAVLGVKDLICGAICRETRGRAVSLGMRVFPFVSGGAEEVLSAWKSGTLSASRFAMPGCAGRGLCCCRRGRRGRENQG